MSGVRLTERISVVGGGATGLGISHTLDPNVYLLSGGEELALVDAGAGPGEARILDNVRSLGYDPERIGHIFLTHAHADHAGGAASLSEKAGGAGLSLGAGARGPGERRRGGPRALDRPAERFLSR